MNHISRWRFLGILLVGIIIIFGNDTYAGGKPTSGVRGGFLGSSGTIVASISPRVSVSASPGVSASVSPSITDDSENTGPLSDNFLGLSGRTWLIILLLALIALILAWLARRGNKEPEDMPPPPQQPIV